MSTTTRRRRPFPAGRPCCATLPHLVLAPRPSAWPSGASASSWLARAPCTPSSWPWSCWLPFNPLSLRRRLQEWYLRGRRQEGPAAPAHWGVHRRDWDPHALSADLLALDPRGLARPPTGPGPGPHQLRRSLHGPEHQRPVSRLCRPGDLDRASRRRARRLGAALGTHAQGILAGRVPAGWQVLVLTDRGMYSPRLFRCLVGTALAPVPADPRPGVLPARSAARSGWI